MDRLVFAAVADDDTGASDLAGMLAGQNVRTLLIIDAPPVDQFLNWSRGYDAVVMAIGTRNLTPALARERTRQAIRILEARHPVAYQIKYCSTFDSTPAGNIGPSIEAALDELDEAFTIAVPALPVNGRTTYMGYHFVHRQLLSDSPMRDHPLTPMTNSNLVDLLGRQTTRRCGLAPYAEVEAGAERLGDCFRRLRREGIAIAVVDCLSDRHVESICRAAADLRLITGGSAFGMMLPAVWRERGLLAANSGEKEDFAARAPGCGSLLVAGSCSVATRGQNEWLAAQGTPIVEIDPFDFFGDNRSWAGEVIARVCGHLAAGRHCLLTTSSTPEKIREVQEWGMAVRGLTIPLLGEHIARGLAELVSEIMETQAIGGLIVAGGETAGAVCRRLELGALRVGRNIEPGVPLCFSLGRYTLPVALKSGNFGSPDFYGRALRALARPADYLG